MPLWLPRPEVKFHCTQVGVGELVQARLPSKMTGVAYRPSQRAHLATILSAEVQDLVKTVTPP